MHQHTDNGFGTALGAVLGLFSAWDLNQFSDEIHTAKLAAIGAVVGFVITTLMKWLKIKLSKPKQS